MLPDGDVDGLGRHVSFASVAGRAEGRLLLVGAAAGRSPPRHLEL